MSVHIFSIPDPGQVARENLLLLFDQARAKYERLPGGQVGTPAAPGKGRGRGKAAQKPRAPLAQLLPVLAVRFAHAHGGGLLSSGHLTCSCVATLIMGCSLLSGDWLARQAVVAHGLERVYAPFIVSCLRQAVLGIGSKARRRLSLAEHV